MFNIGPWEASLIFGSILILFGGKKLPAVATGLGTAIKNFKKALNDNDDPNKQIRQKSDSSETPSSKEES